MKTVFRFVPNGVLPAELHIKKSWYWVFSITVLGKQELYKNEQTLGRLYRADADLHASFTLQSHLCALSFPSTCHSGSTVIVKPGHFLLEHMTYQSSISLPHYHLTVLKGLRRRVGRKRGGWGWRQVISLCHDMTLCHEINYRSFAAHLCRQINRQPAGSRG